METGDRNARADCDGNYGSLPRPPIFPIVPSPSPWTGASPAAAFSLSWFPPATTLGFWWVQFSFQALAVAERGCELLRCQPKMHEIAEASSITFSVFILSAAGLTEIRDWGKFCIQRSTCIPSVVQVLDRGLRLCFPFETGVNVTNEMITNVITHLFRIVSAINGLNTMRVHVHGAQEGAQILPARSTDLHKPHRSPPEVPWESNGKPDREPDCGRR